MKELVNNMNIQQLTYLAPAIRLVSGLEMAGYREALLESLQDDRVNEPESKALAEEYNLALDIYSLCFEPVIN